MARAAPLSPAVAVALALVLGAGTARAAPWAAEDDFVRAFAAAKAKGALVLVDVWAPW